MKKLTALLITILILFTGCELFYPEAEGDIYLVTVALSYRGTDIRILEGTLPDQKAIRSQFETLSIQSGRTFREAAIIQDNGVTTEQKNLSLTLDGSDVKQLITETINQISSTITENDTLIFYYSGHGDQDGSLIFTWENRMSPDELLSTVKPLDCRKLLILDCCYSGHYVEESSTPDNFIDAYKSIFSGNKSTDNNLWVMAAALANQEAWDSGEHGYFTEAILEFTGYDLENETASTSKRETISFLSLSNSIKYHLKSKLSTGTGYMEQYPISTLTGRDLVLFSF